MEHKHKGVTRANGTLRLHPIERNHKETLVIREHNKSLNKSQQKYSQKIINVSKPIVKKPIVKKPIVKKPVVKENDTKQKVLVPVDADGFISIDMTKMNLSGIRVSFIRIEGRTKKTIGLQIDNE